VPRLQGDLADTEATVASLQARQTQLSRTESELRKQAGNLQSLDLTQEDLARDVKIEEKEYQLYLDKREQAKMSSSLNQEGILNVLIVQPPLVPALPDYSFKFLVVLTSFLALILAIVTAFVVDMFDPTIRTPSELAEVLDAPLFEEFPKGLRDVQDVA
jgi:uncharacterized protein involved in exopolysaccharide biosynthesis